MNMLWAQMLVELQTPGRGRQWVEVPVILDQAVEETEEEHTVDLGAEAGVEAEAEIRDGIEKSGTALRTAEDQRMISNPF